MNRSIMLAYALPALILASGIAVLGRPESSVVAGAPVQRALPLYIPPKGYVCYRAKALIAIDGRLDKPAWSDVPWTDAFVDIEGDAKPLPRLRTRVKMLWDDQYFYIGAELEEPHVWGTLMQHDSVIFQDND